MKTAGSVCWRRRGRHSGGGLNLAGFWHSHKTACWSVVCCWTGKSKKQSLLCFSWTSVLHGVRLGPCSVWISFVGFNRLLRMAATSTPGTQHSPVHNAIYRLQGMCVRGGGGLGAHPSLVAHTTVIISYLLKVLRRATHLNARRVLPAWRADL